MIGSSARIRPYCTPTPLLRRQPILLVEHAPRSKHAPLSEQACSNKFSPSNEHTLVNEHALSSARHLSLGECTAIRTDCTASPSEHILNELAPLAERTPSNEPLIGRLLSNATLSCMSLPILFVASRCAGAIRAKLTSVLVVPPTQSE